MWGDDLPNPQGKCTGGGRDDDGARGSGSGPHWVYGAPTAWRARCAGSRGPLACGNRDNPSGHQPAEWEISKKVLDK